LPKSTPATRAKKVAAIEEDQWPDITGGRKVRTIPLRGYTLREKFGYTPGRGSCAIPVQPKLANKKLMLVITPVNNSCR
jgi:hypothetical protein